MLKIIAWSTTIRVVLTSENIEVYYTHNKATASSYVEGYYNTNLEKHSKTLCWDVIEVVQPLAEKL